MDAMERAVARSMDRAIRGGGAGATRVAALMGVSRCSVDAWCAGRAIPAHQLLGLAATLLEEPELRENGLALVSDLLRPLGLDAVPLPTPIPDSRAEHLVMRAAAAAGELAAVTDKALEDRRVDHVEACDIERAGLRVQRIGAESVALARGIQLAGPQRRLEGVR